MTSPAPRPATLSDVAREAGVSLATASRVLNGSTRQVAPDYRKRVEETAEKLAYTANLSAQATARGTSAIIALLVADIADPYFAELAAGVARGADEAGLVVTVGITGRDPDREVRLVRAFRGQRPRGLILAASRMAAESAPELRRELDAVTAVGGRVVILGNEPGSARSVGIDNRGGAEALGSKLAALGYRDAVVLAAREGITTSDDRLAGFTTGFTAAGGTEPVVRRGEFSRAGGTGMMREALADGIAPGTLVFGISDVLAIGAVHALREAGRAIGNDVAVAGFNDVAAARDIDLTTVRVPLEAVGHQAFLAATAEHWEPAPPARLEVRLRSTTPPVAP